MLRQNMREGILNLFSEQRIFCDGWKGCLIIHTRQRQRSRRDMCQ